MCFSAFGIQLSELSRPVVPLVSAILCVITMSRRTGVVALHLNWEFAKSTHHSAGVHFKDEQVVAQVVQLAQVAVLLDGACYVAPVDQPPHCPLA